MDNVAWIHKVRQESLEESSSSDGSGQEVLPSRASIEMKALDAGQRPGMLADLGQSRDAAISADPVFREKMDEAMAQGSLKAFAQLMASSSPVSTIDRLFKCAATGDHAGLQILIEEGVQNLHIPHAANMATALMLAIACGHAEVIKVLIRHATKEELRYRDPLGNSALSLALDSTQIIAGRNLLLAGAGGRDERGRTPLVAAIEEDREARINTLLKVPVNVKNKCANGATALEAAVGKGRCELAIRLIKAGARANHRDLTRNGPLAIAALCGYVDIAVELIGRGAVIDRQNTDGNTALHLAAWNGHGALVTLLLKHGAQAGLVDSRGRTALQHAVENGKLECCRLLIQHGADVNHADADGHTALDICDDKVGAESELAGVLREQGARGRCCKPCVIL
jgi:ankyrin repeat protein